MSSASEIQAHTNDTHSEVTESSKHGSFSNDQPEERNKGKSDNADGGLKKDGDASTASEPEQTEAIHGHWRGVATFLKDDKEALNCKISDYHPDGKVVGSSEKGKSDNTNDGLTKKGTELQTDSASNSHKGKSDNADGGLKKDSDASTVSEPEQTTVSEPEQTEGKSDNTDDGLTKMETELTESEDGSNDSSSASEPENSEGANGIPKDDIYYMPLHKAAIHGDWRGVERFLKDDKEALTSKISQYYTILHVAVSTGHSIPFVQQLVNLMPVESLATKNAEGDTPLHYAAIAGNTKAAKILVEKDLTLTQLTNDDDYTPLHCAADYGHRETVRYLLTVTRDENPSPFAGKRGAKLLNFLITAEFYDIALDILKRYSKLAIEEDSNWNTALLTLAKKPKAFPSGSNPTIYEHILTTFAAAFNRRHNVTRHGDVENPGSSSKEFPKESKLYKFLQSFNNKALMHQQALQLLRILVSETVKYRDKEAYGFLGPSVRLASQLGIHEFVIEVIKAYPLSLWLYDKDRRNFFHLAVIHRQENVFNLLFQVSSYKHFITQSKDSYSNNMLHLAAKLAPSSRISGAALQMQRELQWFKEVEKIVPPAYKEMENKEKKTPRMVFKEEHQKLVEQGEKWMKDTASSCALVAALVVTVVFAANFTAPGGNDQNTGFPIFLNTTSFMIFAIANALALFSSSASLLMFLGILTSRYSEEDFLRSLPMRLSIGLITLFFSIVAMLVAFSASLQIVLSHKVSWIGVPIGLGACVPVTLFALLQFPLLVQIVFSTFGPSIFRKQGVEILI